MKKSKNLRLAFIHSGDSDSEVAKLITAIIKYILGEQGKEVLIKKLADSKWWNNAVNDYSHFTELKIKVSSYFIFQKLCLF